MRGHKSPTGLRSIVQSKANLKTARATYNTITAQASASQRQPQSNTFGLGSMKVKQRISKALQSLKELGDEDDEDVNNGATDRTTESAYSYSGIRN